MVSFSYTEHHSTPTSTLFPYTTLFRSSALRTWSDSYKLELIGQDALPFNQEDWPNPLRIPPRLDYIDQSIRELLLRSEEHTSELQSPYDIVCRLLLEKKKIITQRNTHE